MNCETCNKSLPQDGDYVTCGKCGAELHYQCAGILKSTWKSKNTNKKAEWECAACKPLTRNRIKSNTDHEEDKEDDPTFKALKNLLERMFKRQEEKIAARVDSLVTLVGSLEDSISRLFDKVKEVEESNLELRKELDEVRLDLECEKQYGRSKNFVVTSLPQTEKEDVPEKICSLLNKMNIDLKKEEITAHRLPSPRSPAPIIIQCTTRAIRDNIVRSARKFRPTTSLISGSQPERAIYFNDHLTPYFSNLMKEAKTVKEQKGYKFIWLNGNRIMLKKDNNSKAIRVVKPEDLDKLA